MSAFVLKIIAMLAMLLDHTAAVFEPQFASVSPWLYTGCRMFGRLAFPLFALGIAEGAVHTRSPKKYLLRMALFALAAQIPFSLMLGTTSSGRSFQLLSQTVPYAIELSVMVTLFLGLAVCIALEKKKPFAAAVALAAAYAIDLTVGMDYGFLGVLFILSLYLSREKKLMRFLIMLIFPLLFFFSPVKACVLELIKGGPFRFTRGVLYCISMAAAGIAVLFYNGKPGKKLGVFGYIFYPAHMLVLWTVWFILRLGGSV